MAKLLVFALVGLVAQLIDGALGMAYGVTSTTLLLSTGTTAAVASASVHLAEVGTTFASGAAHWRFGNVSWTTVLRLGVPGAVGAFAGATVLTDLDGDRMQPIVSGLLLALGAYIVVRFALGTMRKAVPEAHLRLRFLAPLGAVGGFVDAVGGGGWGPVTTPTLMTAGRMEPHRAVGSASASEFLVAVAASIGFFLALDDAINLVLVGGLLAGGVAAAPLAAWVIRRLDPRILGTMVGSLVMLTNARTLMRSFGVDGSTRLVVLTAGVLAVGALVVRMRRTLKLSPVAPTVAAV